MSARRKLGLVGLGLLLGLVALEIALQAAAWFLWQSRQASRDDAAGGSGGVLCVGDSFTFGLGAADRDANAYPRVLAEELSRAGGEDVRVVNAGLPGSDSAAILARLPRQLDAWQPALVYVLVGYNDFWSTRPPVDEAAGFPLELRSLRLFRMVWTAIAGGRPVAPEGAPDALSDAGRDGQESEPAPFVGAWHAGPIWLAFEPGGAVSGADGETDLLWTRDGYEIVLTPLEGGDELRVAWRLADGALELEGGPFPARLRFEPGLPERHDLDRGRIAERAGDVDRALELYAAAAEVPELAVDAERARLALAVRAGRDEVAGAVLERLGPMVDAAGPDAFDPRLAIAVIDAGLAIGDAERAGARLVRMVGSGELSERMLRFVTRRALDVPDRDALDGALAARLEASDLSDPQRFALWGLRVELAPDDTALAARALVEIARRQPAAKVLRHALRDRPELASADVLDDAVSAVVADPDERARVLAAIREAATSGDQTVEGLGANLAAIVRRGREAGAEVVLLTYPIERRDVTAAVRRVARDLGCDIIDVFAEFRARVPAADLSGLFIADGHCNDAGYRLMGEIVAEHAIPALRPGKAGK